MQAAYIARMPMYKWVFAIYVGLSHFSTFFLERIFLAHIKQHVMYKAYQVEEGAIITPEEEPTKEGYTFSGWSELPETMPAHDVTVTGSFTTIELGD